jgi:transposase-like protein
MPPLTAKQQYWSDHLHKADAFDGSVADYARHHGLPAKTLYQWRGLLRQRQAVHASKVTFAEVVPESVTPVPAHSLTLQLGQAQLQFHSLPDTAWLAQLITAHD